MRSKIALAVFTVLATVSTTIAHTHEAVQDNDYPEVSRLGRNVLTLTQVTTPGFTTPKVLYNKTKNATEEPRYKDNLTPLGQRQ